MNYKLGAAALAIVTAAALATAAMADGPKASSENFIPNPASVPVNTSDPAMLGPRASGENHIVPGTLAASAGPQYVWQDGYDRHGWHGHWVLER
jgi:hypothetical protein